MFGNGWLFCLWWNLVLVMLFGRRLFFPLVFFLDLLKDLFSGKRYPERSSNASSSNSTSSFLFDVLPYSIHILNKSENISANKLKFKLDFFELNGFPLGTIFVYLDRNLLLSWGSSWILPRVLCRGVAWSVRRLPRSSSSIIGASTSEVSSSKGWFFTLYKIYI